MWWGLRFHEPYFPVQAIVLTVGYNRNRAQRRKVLFGKGTKPFRGWDGIV